jgi:hypothetical protein
MREFVFPDPSLTSRAGQFVWLAINIEEEKNAPFLVKFPGEGVPTFAVVDPKDESVVLRLVGSMTVAQLHAFHHRAQGQLVGLQGPGEIGLGSRAADLHVGQQRPPGGGAYRLALGQAPVAGALRAGRWRVSTVPQTPPMAAAWSWRGAQALRHRAERAAMG